MRSALLPAIVVGRFGEEQLVSGWHERQHDGRSGLPYVAASGEATARLAPAPAGRLLHLVLSGPVGLAGQPLVGTLRINGQPEELRLAVDAWVWRSFRLPGAFGGPLDLTFHLPNPIVPDAILHNGDSRALGWFVSALWVE